MKQLIQILSVLFLYFSSTCGQCATLQGVIPDMIIECRREGAIHANTLAVWQRQCNNCEDPFLVEKPAADFYLCLALKVGYLVDGVVNATRLLELYSFVNPDRITRIIEKCKATYPPTENLARSIYLIHKCLDKSLGLLPWGVRRVPIDNAQPEQETVCREKYNLSVETICRLESVRTRKDPFAVNFYSSRCYHVCVLQQMGFVDGQGEPVMELFRERFFYVGKGLQDEVFQKCYYKRESDGPCEAIYRAHACMMREFGEYPIRMMSGNESVESVHHLSLPMEVMHRAQWNERINEENNSGSSQHVYEKSL